MTSSNIKDVLNGENGFSAKLEMIGINGLCSPFHNHVFDLVVESTPFDLKGSNYRLETTVRGSFSQFYPSSAMIERSSTVAAESEAENKQVLEEMFIADSNHFAFTKSDLDQFFDGGHFIRVVPTVRKNNLVYSIPELEKSDADFARDALYEFLQKTKKAFFAGDLDADKSFRSKFGN